MLNSVLTVFADLMHWILDNKAPFFILAAISIITFVATLLAIPYLIVRIPADYFSHERKRRKPAMTVNPMIRIGLLIAKNILGYIIIMAGVVMLVLPGQGILTILVGIMLVDFPGKFRLERRLVTQPKVLHAVNWLRLRSGKAELIIKV